MLSGRPMLPALFACWLFHCASGMPQDNGDYRRPQYLLFTRTETSWSHMHPSTLTAEFLRAPLVAMNLTSASSADGTLRVGNELIFSLLQTPDLTILEASVRAALDAAVEAQVPVSLVFDSQNWWSESPELWNWWNQSLPGYNPLNRYNVEWTEAGNPASAVKIGWRNWGSQIRVAPEQNILSPVVMDAVLPRLRFLAGVVVDWLNADYMNRRELLATVKIGWEAGVQYNAYYYPNGNALVNNPNASQDPTTGLNFSDTANPLGGGLPILGYAAAESYGYKLKPGRNLTGLEVARITVKYVERLAETLLQAQIPAEFISNHVGGQVPPYTAVPFSAAFMPTTLGVPGWSFYWGLPNATDHPLGAAMASVNRTQWAAAEWRLDAQDTAAFVEHFEATLNFLDCRHLSYYNWDGAFDKNTVGHEAVRALLAARS